MDHEAYPSSPHGSREGFIKELAEFPIAKFREGVANTKVRPTHDSVQSGF